MNICRTCKEPLTELNRSLSSDRRSCKRCFSARMKAWREPHKDRINRQRRAAKHGLTAVELDILETAHGGLCLACGDEAELVIDHDHNTGRVRGMLCNRCNVAVGMLLDSARRASKVARYITVHCESAV